MNKIILQNGTIITASNTYKADILIEGERISRIGKDLPIDDAETIDASDRLILPGGIDPHVHLSLPMFDTISSDDHYTGTKAAAFGGTTTVLDFVPQEDDLSLQGSVDLWHRKADHLAAVDFGFHMNVTRLDEQVEAEIPKLIDAGITTVKTFTAYNGRLRLQDGEIFRVLRIARNSGMLTMLHAENGDVIDVLTADALARGETEPIWHARTRPAWGAVESVLRACALSAQADAPLYIVHMNTGGGVDQLAYARQRGVPVMGETCPQYLFFTEEHLEREDGAKWICSPPMRTRTDNQRLWQGLEQNILQVIGTDHCPFFYDGTMAIDYEGQPVRIPGKELGADDFTKIPNGLPGVGDRLPVLWTHAVFRGRLIPNQFVAQTSTNPAKIFGLYPQKGAILPGADADLVLWDPEKLVVHGVARSHHRTDYNLYEGWELTGYPEKVLLRGRVIVDGDAWHGEPGGGRFLHRKPFAEVI